MISFSSLVISYHYPFQTLMNAQTELEDVPIPVTTQQAPLHVFSDLVIWLLTVGQNATVSPVFFLKLFLNTSEKFFFFHDL